MTRQPRVGRALRPNLCGVTARRFFLPMRVFDDERALLPLSRAGAHVFFGLDPFVALESAYV
jgi:hypothetical protein